MFMVVPMLPSIHLALMRRVCVIFTYSNAKSCYYHTNFSISMGMMMSGVLSLGCIPAS